jgi:hypothetical protein
MRRSLVVPASVFLLLAVLLSPNEARAADPNLAEYVMDGSRIFWFSWITDTHIDTLGSANEESRLGWATGEAVAVVHPFFLVATGDLTDGTDGFIYGTGPHQEEWDSYRAILVDGSGMGADFYYDVPGNHDAYGDGALDFYRANSVQGTADDQMQHQWRLDLPFGSYHFVAAATPANDGRQWPFDNSELSVEELDQTAAFFAGNPDVDLAFVFGHHDYTACDRANVLRDQMIAAGAAHYFHGHVHDVAASVDGNIFRFRMDSLGQSANNNYGVVAVDANAVSLNLVSADSPWPLVVVTAPVDARLGPGDDTINLYSPPVPTSCGDAPVRALVFDSAPITAVRFQWDGGEWIDMTRRPGEDAQWRGRFDAGTLAAGLHSLTVEAAGSTTRSTTIQVDTVDGTCDLGPEDPPPGADADGDGDGDADADGDSGADGDAAADGDTRDGADTDARPDAPPVDVPVDDATDEGDGGTAKSAGSGCGCRTAGGARHGLPFFGLASGLALFLCRRRRSWAVRRRL